MWAWPGRGQGAGSTCCSQSQTEGSGGVSSLCGLVLTLPSGADGAQNQRPRGPAVDRVHEVSGTFVSPLGLVVFVSPLNP